MQIKKLVFPVLTITDSNFKRQGRFAVLTQVVNREKRHKVTIIGIVKEKLSGHVIFGDNFNDYAIENPW